VSMKKLFAALMLLVIIAGCSKEKVYKENLNGEWSVYKYLLHNVDRTNLFNTTYPGYKITFTEAGAFTEWYLSADTVEHVGTYSFIDNDEKILLTHIELDLVDTTYVPREVKREYTIFNLTKDHVQLRNDTSQLYMEKKME
jgi:hypothetical protein